MHKGRFIGCSSWTGALVPRNKAKVIAMGRETKRKGKRKRERACTCRERENAERGRNPKCLDYVGKPLGCRVQGRGQGVPAMPSNR